MEFILKFCCLLDFNKEVRVDIDDGITATRGYNTIKQGEHNTILCT